MTLAGSELIRWLVVAVLVIAGIGLFFDFAPSTKPPVPPSVDRKRLGDAVQVTLPDGSQREAPAGTTAAPDRRGIGAGLARAALAARVNGEIWDLDRPHRARRVGRHTDREGSRGARACSGIRRRTSWPPRCGSCFPTPASASARRSRTASTTTSRWTARSRPRTCSGSRPRWPRWRRATSPSCGRWWTGARPVAALPTTRSSWSGSPSWATTRRSRSTPTGRSSISAAGPTFPAPGGSSTSSCCTPPAPTGGATRSGRCCSGSTAPPGSRRRTSRPTSTGWRRPAGATTGCSASSSISSRSRRWWVPGWSSGTPRGP